MELVEVLFGVGGWIVATLVVLINIRRDLRHKAKLKRLKGLLTSFILAVEKQRIPLNRVVALAQPGSEVRDQAVTALQVVNTAVQSVVRAEPELKPVGSTSSADKPSTD
jgi:hypothetical protein